MYCSCLTCWLVLSDLIFEDRFPTALLAACVLSQFGVSDAEGGVCLWQVGLGLGSLGTNKPYLVQVHTTVNVHVTNSK